MQVEIAYCDLSFSNSSHIYFWNPPFYKWVMKDSYVLDTFLCISALATHKTWQFVIFRAIADVMSRYEPRVPEVKLREKEMILSGV